MLADTDLTMAGYGGESVAEMQKRTVDALKRIPSVKSVGLIDAAPLASGGFTGGLAFTDETTDLRAGNAAADAYQFSISPEYFEAAGTALLSGRVFSWHDDKTAPAVAVVNHEFARKVFGSEAKALGKYFKKRDGTHVQVVGIVENGKYSSLTEDEPAMFLPIQQSPSSQIFFVMRSTRDDAQLAPAIRNTVHGLDASLPLYIEPWSKAMDAPLFGPRMATLSLGVLGAMGAMLSITGIFGMAAYAVSKRLRELGIRMALGAQGREVLGAALGRAIKLLAFGSAAGLLLGILASRVLAAIVYQATPRDPLVLTAVVVAMALLGLVATWIPAQRALSVDPATLLREE